MREVNCTESDWLQLTLGGIRELTEFMISVKLAQIWLFENVEAAYMVWKVFLQCILWVWQRTGFSAISSTGSLNEQLFLVGSHQFLVDYFWNSKRQQQSFLLPLTKGCLFLQNVSSISVVRIRVFFPAHEKLGDFKGFPSLLQDSFKKSDLWSLWPKKRNVYQINSYLSFRWVKMLYLPFDILQTASLFRLKWRRSCF